MKLRYTRGLSLLQSFSTFNFMRRIYLATDISQAQLLVDLLGQAMIPAVIQNAHQSGGLGELAVTYPEIWLKREADEARALQVIERFEGPQGEAENDRVCSRCRERNPAGFDLCWSCGADL